MNDTASYKSLHSYTSKPALIISRMHFLSDLDRVAEYELPLVNSSLRLTNRYGPPKRSALMMAMSSWSRYKLLWSIDEFGTATYSFEDSTLSRSTTYHEHFLIQ